MKRFSLSDLASWWHKKERAPLIIRGARQVGKTTLVRMFAHKFKLDLIEINLQRTKIKSFSLSVSDENFSVVDAFIEIESFHKKKISPSSLVFLDEIQAEPKARERLKFFNQERPDIPVIAAGPIHDFKLVSENIFHLGPMTFLEFLLACGEELLVEIIISKKIPDSAHQKALQFLKYYSFVGGMPEAVRTFVETKSMIAVREVHRSIVQTNQTDFPKYGKRLNLERLERVFQAAPFHLGKKIIYQKLDEVSKSNDIKKCLELLIAAQLFTPCYHSDAYASLRDILCSGPRRTKDSGVDLSVYRLFCLDIGILNTIHSLEWKNIDQHFLMTFTKGGILAEQFIAQHLSYIKGVMEPPHLHFWMREKSTQKAEIDFLLQISQDILPVEVKDGRGGKLKSLIIFAQEKNIRTAVKFSLDPFSEEKIPIKIDHENQNQVLQVFNYPLYSVETIADAYG